MKLDKNIIINNPRKNKILVFSAILFLITVLYSACYMLFFRPIVIDVTSDLAIVFRGEDGNGSLEVAYNKPNANRRLDTFLDSLKYQVTPNSNLKNGDKVKITAEYDHDIAQSFKIKVKNSKKDYKITELPQRYKKSREIKNSFMKQVKTKSETYLDKMMDSILISDFSMFETNVKAKLVETQDISSFFLKANNVDNNDKIVFIYSISASGKSINGDGVSEKVIGSIYYAITINNINTANMLHDEDIYGEKLINISGIQLDDETQMNTFMQQKYASNYFIELTKK